MAGRRHPRYDGSEAAGAGGVRADELVDIEGLRVSISSDGSAVEILHGVDLSVRRGDFGVIGESGSGKTMTGALAASGCFPQRGRQGGAVCASDLMGLCRCWSDGRLRTNYAVGRLAMIFQDPVGVVQSCEDHPGTRPDGVPQGRIEDRPDAQWRRSAAGGALLAESVWCASRPSWASSALYPHQLTGGMLQRALIAMVLALEPDVIVADEPTTNLDYLVERQILRPVPGSRARLSSAIVFITHDMAVAAELCDRIAVMYAGEVVETGPAEAMFGALHPYTRALVETATNSTARRKRLREIPGELPTAATRPHGCLFAPRCPLAHERCLPALRR